MLEVERRFGKGPSRRCTSGSVGSQRSEVALVVEIREKYTGTIAVIYIIVILRLEEFVSFFFFFFFFFFGGGGGGLPEARDYSQNLG